MDESIKRSKLIEIFPPRVEKLIKALQVAGNCSKKSAYGWDQDIMHDIWVQIARAFAKTADSFGVRFEVLVDGVEVDYIEPKSKRKTK